MQSQEKYQKEKPKKYLNENIKESYKDNIKEYESDNLKENIKNIEDYQSDNSKDDLIDNSDYEILNNSDNSKENPDKSKEKENVNLFDNIKENFNKNQNLEENKIDNQKENNNLNYYLNQIQNLSVFFKNDFINSPEFKNEEIKNEYNYFLEHYNNFIGIKKFSIPIFGIISSGKSTLLNYIINLDNILEMDEDVSTQFICIIRNKKGLKIPKLYSVILDWRDEHSFNFLKGNEIPEDIKTIISEKNKKIRESNIDRKPEDYFLLIEIDIPFLNESEGDFGDLFEFMDFPGLNESIAKNNNKLNLFYEDYLPILIPNTKFPIFIFDITSFEGRESSNVLEYYKDFTNKHNFPYLNKICKDSFNEAIFILNKSDLLNSEEKKLIN